MNTLSFDHRHYRNLLQDIAELSFFKELLQGGNYDHRLVDPEMRIEVAYDSIGKAVFNAVPGVAVGESTVAVSVTTEQMAEIKEKREAIMQAYSNDLDISHMFEEIGKYAVENLSFKA